MAIWSRFKALAALGISVSSLRGTWDPYGRTRAGREKEKLATDLGAHVYVDTAVEDGSAVLQRLGGARAILATGTSGDAMGPLVSGLAARGKFIVVGVPSGSDPAEGVFAGVWRTLNVRALTGTPIDNEDTLAFSVLQNIRPMIETLPLERAAGTDTRE